WKET
ncbi:nucleoside diphosphate kinase family protein, partial [Vibrio parahaemolyticus V-223/04]